MITGTVGLTTARPLKPGAAWLRPMHPVRRSLARTLAPREATRSAVVGLPKTPLAQQPRTKGRPPIPARPRSARVTPDGRRLQAPQPVLHKAAPITGVVLQATEPLEERRQHGRHTLQRRSSQQQSPSARLHEERPARQEPEQGNTVARRHTYAAVKVRTARSASPAVSPAEQL